MASAVHFGRRADGKDESRSDLGADRSVGVQGHTDKFHGVLTRSACSCSSGCGPGSVVGVQASGVSSSS